MPKDADAMNDNLRAKKGAVLYGECKEILEHHVPLKPPALTPNIESGDFNTRLLGNPGHALPVRRTHPPSDISLDRLAVTTHWRAPSSPRVCD